MADVSVEFGAKDTGLEQTLKTIQDQLVSLDGELKTGTLSFEEINKKMREAAQAEKLHSSLGGTKDQIEALGLSFKQTAPEVEKFAEGQKDAAQGAQKASTSFQSMAGEMFELKAALENGNLSADEFDKTLRRLNKLEDIKEKMDAFGQSTQGAGESADQASPQVEEIGTDIKKAGNEAEDFGEKSKGGFLKMATAVAAGQAAVNIATAAIKGAFNLAKGSIDEFGAALDLGGRLDDLSIQTGIAAGELLVLERAFQNSGAGADKVSTTISKVASAIVDASTGTGAASAAFDRLGLSASELINLPADKQFEKISAALSGVANETERSALANDIFGQRLAKDLLPLISDFGGEINKAGGQLGSLPGIINTAAASFAAIGDNVKVIQGKFTEFASGILAAMTPALQAITEGLSRIDAAGLGKKLADAFVGGTTAMKGFQAAVDAFKVGNIGEAFSMLWESIKLQGLQTANEVGRNLVAGFSTAIDFLKEIFNPSGAIVNYMGATFLLIGSKLQAAMGNAMLAFIDALPGWFTAVNPIIGAVGDAIRSTVTKATEEANDQWSLMYHSTGEVATQIAGAASRIKDNMNVNLSETGDLIGGLNERATALKTKQDEVAAAVASTNAAKQAGIDMAPIEQGNVAALLAEEKLRLENELDTAKAKGDAAEKTFAQIENEIELNNAIATGNQEEIKRVEAKQKQAEISAQIKANEEAIPEIVARILDSTGLSAEAAQDLAEQLVASRNAALGAADNSAQIKAKLNDAGVEAKTVKGLMDDIANAKMEASPERLKERTADARTELKSMADFIGQDISNLSLDNILTKLGLDPGNFATTDQKLTALEGSLKKISSADPADITPDVDLVGVNDRLEKVKQYLANVKKPDATPTMDQAAVQQAAESAKETIESQRPEIVAEVNQAALNDAVSQMQAQITNHFTGGDGGPGGDATGGQGGDGGLGGDATGGQGGAGGLGGDAIADITALVNLLNPWTQIITSIRDRLPMQALAY